MAECEGLFQRRSIPRVEAEWEAGGLLTASATTGRVFSSPTLSEEHITLIRSAPLAGKVLCHRLNRLRV